MSRGLKIALVVTAAALFLCCVAGLGVALLGTRLIGRALITDPERVQTVGREIADYDVPPGYEEMFAMNVMGMRVVAIGPSGAASEFMMFMLMQFPGGMQLSREEMERQLQQALARQVGMGRADMQVVGQEETVIKGEPVTLTVREGSAESGERLRQVTGLFSGKAGPAMLMIMGDVSGWDQAMVDDFVASIR